jgi:hypothetical protein
MRMKLTEMLGVEFPIWVSDWRAVAAPTVSNTVRSGLSTGMPSRVPRSVRIGEPERGDGSAPFGIPPRSALTEDPLPRINDAAAQPDSNASHRDTDAVGHVSGSMKRRRSTAAQKSDVITEFIDAGVHLGESVDQ